MLSPSAGGSCGGPSQFFVGSNAGCFYIGSDFAVFDQAFTKCNEMGGSLAHFVDFTKFEAVRNFLLDGKLIETIYFIVITGSLGHISFSTFLKMSL